MMRELGITSEVQLSTLKMDSFADSLAKHSVSIHARRSRVANLSRGGQEGRFRSSGRQSRRFLE